MSVEVRITMDDAGQVGFSATTDNVILIYGLLTIAHDTVAAQQAANAGKRIITPSNGMLGPINGNR